MTDIDDLRQCRSCLAPASCGRPQGSFPCLSGNIFEKFWDEKGWEHIVDSEDATPGVSSYLHSLNSSDSESSEIPPDGASSGTIFESGSEISSDAERIVEQVTKREEAGVAAKCKVYRNPPASPELCPAVQHDSEGNEMRPSSGFARALEHAIKAARSADN